MASQLSLNGARPFDGDTIMPPMFQRPCLLGWLYTKSTARAILRTTCTHQNA